MMQFCQIFISQQVYSFDQPSLQIKACLSRSLTQKTQEKPMACPLYSAHWYLSCLLVRRKQHRREEGLQIHLDFWCIISLPSVVIRTKQKQSFGCKGDSEVSFSVIFSIALDNLGMYRPKCYKLKYSVFSLKAFQNAPSKILRRCPQSSLAVRDCLI